jgi:hypothetical protein
MSKLIGLVLFGLWGGVLSAAPPDTLVLRQMAAISVDSTLEIRHLTADALGHIYVVQSNNRIQKYRSDGQPLAFYSQNRLGRAAKTDASQAPKLLVWYADYRSAIMLDRNMTELGGKLDFSSGAWSEARTVAPAADGNLWLYDEANFHLSKIDPTAVLLRESQEMNLLTDRSVHIHQICDNGTTVAAVDTTWGVLLFDAFAQFQRSWVIPAVWQCQLTDRELIALTRQRELVLLPISGPGQAIIRHLPIEVLQSPQLWLIPGGLAGFDGKTISIWQW